MGKLIVSESISLDGVFEAPPKMKGEKFPLAGWAEIRPCYRASVEIRKFFFAVLHRVIVEFVI